MAGYLGASPVPQSILKKESKTLTANQTTVNTSGYTHGGSISVTLNGVLLEGAGVDYTATNGSDIVLTAGATAGDILHFQAFNEFTLVGQELTTPTINDATLKSNVTLKNDTEEDSDGGRASKIIYQGEQSGGEISTLAEIQASHDGTADDQKSDLIFRTNDGSDGTSPTETLRLKNDGNLLLGTTVAGRAAEGADRLTIADAAHSGLTIRSGSTSYGSINFSDSEGGAGEYAGSIFFGHGASLGDRLTFATAGSNRVSIDSDGLKFNNDTAAANALSDYETGTFQLTMTGAANTSALGHGQYVKIGNICHFSWYSASQSITSSVTGVLGGLPFTHISPGNSAYAAVTFAHNTWVSDAASGYINIGTNSIYPTANNSSTASNTSTGTKYVMCSGSYRVG